MFEPNKCPGCAADLPPDAPGGLCPLCLLQHGLGTDGSVGCCQDDLIGISSNGESDPANLIGPTDRTSRVLLCDSHTSNGSPPPFKPTRSLATGPGIGRDRYQILGQIARGGMGAVLKGRDRELGRDVAIKVLLDQHRDRPEFVRRFVDEAQIGGQLQHPGIVPVYELGQFGDLLPYFAMKLVEGSTLAALLAAREDPAADHLRFLNIFEQVCQTVAYAHARGVIHRDLKPSNIMVGAFGEVQVMDWGLAKVLPSASPAGEGSARLDEETTIIGSLHVGAGPTGSQTGSVFGTPAYMAPEQARGDFGLVDERADVFGLGAILCEILTGRPPYFVAAADDGEISDKAARTDLGDALRRLEASGAEPELIHLARNCLAPVSAQRPRDATSVATDLTTYQRGLHERLRRAELSSVAAQAKAEGERNRRRLTVALAAAMVGLFATAGGGGAWLIQQGQSRAPGRTCSCERPCC